MAEAPFNISKRVGKFAADRKVIGWFVVLTLLFAGYMWMKDHPQHNPLAPLDLRHPPGVATNFKLLGLAGKTGSCRAVLERSEVEFRQLSPRGDGPCALVDRTVLNGAPLSPGDPAMTCPVGAGLKFWIDHGLQEAAVAHLGSHVVRVEHLGTNSCRRVNGSRSGPWSEHASGNAIDIAAFVLADGTRVSVKQDWGNDARGDFLKAARDTACDSFRTVLSPEYSAAQADHFHLDQGTRWAQVCR